MAHFYDKYKCNIYKLHLLRKLSGESQVSVEDSLIFIATTGN